MLTAPPAATWPTGRHRTTSPPPSPRRWGVLVPALAALVVGTWAVWTTTVDDTLIVHRYVANLVAGHGLVWNPGEDPVEGFTDTAWLLVHVPFAWLGVPLLPVSKLLGVAAAAGAVWLLARTPATRVGAGCAALAYAVALPTWIHAVAGLETAAFGLALLGAVVLALRADSGHDIPPWALSALWLTAALLRPEGAVAVLPALALWLTTRPARGWAWTGATVAAGAAFMAWRWSYFGWPLPNTFYAKTGPAAELSPEWVETTGFLLAPLLVLAVVLLVRRWRAGLLVALTVAAVWALPAATAPAMDFLSRFAWHGVPVLCLAAGLALDRITPRRTATLAAAIAVGWTVVAGAAHADTRSMVNYGPDLDRAHGAIGRGLAAADLPQNARTVATSDAGAIPYYSGWNAIDYIGLSDEAIAHGADPTARVTAASPTVIVVTSDVLPAQARSHGLDVPRATAGYVQVAAPAMRENYYQVVYAKPEYADRIRDALARSIADSDTGEGYDIGARRWLHRIGVM